MSYRSSYRRGYGRTTRPITPGRVPRVNKRAGKCRDCGEGIAAGVGQLYRESDGAWSVVHVPMEWTGSPVSGFYIGGCPKSTDAQNAGAPWNRDGHVKSERERLAATAATYAAVNRDDMPGRDGGSKYAYTNTGARMTLSSRRCEDAPCCGCCD